MNSETKGISFDSSAQYVRHEVRYERAKGDKIISSTPMIPSRDTFFAQSENLRAYEALISIDTNYKQINSEILGVTGVLVWRNDFDNHYACSCPFLVEINDPTIPAERLGWAYAIVNLIDLGVVDKESKIGLIVDAHLSEVEAINRRREPVVTGLMLPNCFTIIYASADTGGEFLANRMLKAADKVSSLTLSRIESGEIPMNNASNGVAGMNRGFRLLRPFAP